MPMHYFSLWMFYRKAARAFVDCTKETPSGISPRDAALTIGMYGENEKLSTHFTVIMPAH